MSKQIYINDFCEDLNYTGVILYIGNVDATKLREALEKSHINKMWRLPFALIDQDPCKKNFIYIENCDLQNLDYPIHEYFEEGYDVYVLHEDASGGYYVKSKL